MSRKAQKSALPKLFNFARVRAAHQPHVLTLVLPSHVQAAEKFPVEAQHEVEMEEENTIETLTIEEPKTPSRLERVNQRISKSLKKKKKGSQKWMKRIHTKLTEKRYYSKVSFYLFSYYLN